MQNSSPKKKTQENRSLNTAELCFKFCSFLKKKKSLYLLLRRCARQFQNKTRWAKRGEEPVTPQLGYRQKRGDTVSATQGAA